MDHPVDSTTWCSILWKRRSDQLETLIQFKSPIPTVKETKREKKKHMDNIGFSPNFEKDDESKSESVKL